MTEIAFRQLEEARDSIFEADFAVLRIGIMMTNDTME